MSKELGFSIAPTIHVPLPYRKTRHQVRVIRNVTVDYSAAGADSLPYTALDRTWLEMVTTLVKQTGETRLELGRVRDVLDEVGRPSTSYYIASAVRALKRINGMNITFEEEGPAEQFNLFQTTTRGFRIGSELNLIWSRGRSDHERELYLPGMNVFEVSEEFRAYVERAAVPHNATHYRQIDSAKEQDIYQWLVWKMYVLDNAGKGEQFISWESLGNQFWPGHSNPRKELTRFKKNLFEIQQNYYRHANIKSRDDGLMLRRSPLAIEPGSKDAGYQV